MMDCGAAAQTNPLPAVHPWEVRFRAITSGVLPPLPTTALHGALGRALWQEVCVAPARSTCRACPVERTCAYPRLFDPALPEGEAMRAAGVTDEVPRPFILAPDEPLVPTTANPIEVAEGSTIAFRIGLVPTALDALPALRRALRRAGRRGLGGRDRALHLELQKIAPLHVSANAEPPRAVWLDLLTPLRLKHAGRIQSRLEATTFVQALVRRAELLAMAAGEAWQVPFDPIAIATALEVKNEVSVVPVIRYSSTQRTRMTWPGLVGKVRLWGPGLAELWPLLRWGERAQVGKATSFGFGRYRLVLGEG